jgi:hypothetical protein
MKRNYKQTIDPVKGVGLAQAPMGLDIHKYSFNDLLDVFDLKPNLTVEDLKRTRRQVLSLHPDKNRAVSVEHYMFFKSAYELIESYYKMIKQQTAVLPSEEIQYDPDFVPKNQSVDAEIGKINKKDFNARFNTIFESKIKTPEDEERLKWFRDADTQQYDTVKNAKDIHNTFDKIRTNKTGMVVYNGEFAPLTGGMRNMGGNSFYDEPETDQNGYITCNPFDKLKYDDITRVHRDQTIIPVEQSEFARATQMRTLNQYKGAPDVAIMEKEKAQQFLDHRAQMHNNSILEKHHNMQKKVTMYEQMNGDILSQFMLLR